MSTEAVEFLLSLAVKMAATVSPALAIATAPRDLFVIDAIEKDAASVFSVLRTYPGPETPAFADMRRTTLNVQIDTRGTDGPLVSSARGNCTTRCSRPTRRRNRIGRSRANGSRQRARSRSTRPAAGSPR